jgi:hypothetical protein
MSKSTTYPSKRDNDPKENTEPYRDLSLINQSAGNIEFVNTKDDETLTIAYKNGSLLRFNKLSTDELNTQDKREVTMGDSQEEVLGNKVIIYHKDVETINLGNSNTKVGDVAKWQPYFEKIKQLYRKVHDLRRLFEVKRTKKHNDIDQGPNQTKSGALAPTPSAEIISKTLVCTSPTEYEVGIKASCGHQIPRIVENEYEYQDIVADAGWGEFTGWGTGNSPSSQDGQWSEESAKNEITKKREEIQEELFDLEKELGRNDKPDGGTSVDTISKDRVQVTGLAFNDLESFRRDPKGKLVPYGIKIDPFGNSIYTQYRESTLIEHVSVDKMPGGSHHIVANDEFNVTAGSNGINMKTTGSMELYAPITNITTEHLDLNSRGEIALAGERVDISGEIITLRPSKVSRSIEDANGGTVLLPANDKQVTEPEQQVLIDGNLNVEKNAIIAGGMHIEGELTIQHITGPMEEHITDGCFEWGTQIQCILDSTNEANCETGEAQKSPVYGDILAGCLIGYAVVGSGSSAGTWPVYSTCAPNSVMVHDHFHYYKNLPMKLVRDNIDVEMTVGAKTETKSLDPHSIIRSIGSRNNFATRVLAKPVKNSSTQETVVEKFTGNICEPLIITNENWEESNKNETLPNVEGVRSAKYTDEDLKAIIESMNEKFEKRYADLQEQINNISQI